MATACPCFQRSSHGSSSANTAKVRALIDGIHLHKLADLVGELHKRSKLAQGHAMQGNIDWRAPPAASKAGIDACLRRFDVPLRTLKEIQQEQQRTLEAPATLAVGAWVECYARAPLGAEFGAYIGVGIVSSLVPRRASTLKIGLLDKSTDRGWQRFHIDNIAFKQQIELAEVCCKAIGPEDVSAAMCSRLTGLKKRFDAEKTLLRIEFPDG